MPWRKSTSEVSLFSVLSDPADYKAFLESLIKGQGDVGQSLKSKVALKAFEKTAQYEEATSGYFREKYASAELSEEQLAGSVQRISLRYGANPHQKLAQVYVTDGKLPFKGKIHNTPSSIFFNLFDEKPRCLLVLCGSPGYISLLDALNSYYALVKELQHPCRCFFQTCFSLRCCRRHQVKRNRKDGI